MFSVLTDRSHREKLSWSEVLRGRTSRGACDDRMVAGAQRETRARVLAAARALFVDYDYPDCTVRLIAERAGVAPSTVIAQFGSKAGLYREVLEGFGLADWNARPVREDPLSIVLADFAALLETTVSSEELREAMTIGLRADTAARRRQGPAWRRVDDATDVLASRLDGPDAELRAALATAFVSGVVQLRTARVVKSLAEAERGDILRACLPALATLLAPQPSSNRKPSRPAR